MGRAGALIPAFGSALFGLALVSGCSVGLPDGVPPAPPPPATASPADPAQTTMAGTVPEQRVTSTPAPPSSTAPPPPPPPPNPLPACFVPNVALQPVWAPPYPRIPG